MAPRFHDLFVGSEHAHGEWHADVGEKGEGRTKRSPASDADYEAHLSGRLGLGLVPVRGDGTCRFAAIDIDIDTIHHADLYAQVAVRNLPLTVCRSKSGGAHLYLFAAEPGLKTGLVIPTLKRWAGALGFPNAEIFPKQLKVTKTDFGNWINLPYFAGDSTTRYAVGPQGALTLDEFLESVVFWDGRASDEHLVQITTGGMPPCLDRLTQEGLPKGTRNEGLLNFAIFYRKSHPNGWEALVHQHNDDHLKPPLSEREVENIIKSVAKTKYQYTCSREPICSRCDRKACVTLEFGVGHMPWQEVDSYDQLVISHLRKLNSDPPRYIMEVNGEDLELTYEELFPRGEFKKKVCQQLDLIIAPMKQEKWEMDLKKLLDTVTIIEAPKDASIKGMVMDKVHDFLALYERTRHREDLLKGLPVEDGEYVLFRVQDLQRYLTSQRFERLPNEDLFQLLHKEGGDHLKTEVLDKKVSVWRLPKEQVNLQRKEFKQQEFKRGMEAEI